MLQQKMASKLEEDLTCSVCCDFYKDPVILTCSHSVCKACLEKFWETKGSRECPYCRRKCSRDGYPPNLALKNLCETFLQEKGQLSSSSSGSKGLCSLHNQTLALFCLEDQQCVCLVCRDSRKHDGHNFSPIEEAAADLKEELKPKLKHLQKKLEVSERNKGHYAQTADYMKTQAQHTEERIKQDFEELHQLLRDEEATRIAAVREEEEQKSRMMKEKIEKRNREISCLSHTIRDTEEKMAADDVTFLQSYKSTALRVWSPLYPHRDAQRPSGALISVAKHLGNLKFNVWRKMQHMVQYTPVTLDPNTAHPRLVLSEDLTSVRRGDEWQQLPDNAERFDDLACVLGSEGFTSGTHCWDVKVGGNTRWNVGAMTESLQRKGTEWASMGGRWYVWYVDGKYWARSPPQPSTPLKVKQKLQRIRVQLDWDRGKLSFSNPDDDTHIHTFTHMFTERVFPYFYQGCDLAPFSVLPLRLSVRGEQHR